MLVLSRRPDQQIVFPGLEITISVVKVQGHVVKLGIEAPQQIRVVRPDAVASQAASPTSLLTIEERERQHALRNRLNELLLNLYVMQQKLDAGQMTASDSSLEKVFAALAELEREAEPVSVATPVAKRVLVVEDQANERNLLTECLALAGVVVDSVGDGSAALEYLRTQPTPDFVLLDMRIPQVDGPGVLAAIDRTPEWRHLRVFGMSGSPLAEFPNLPRLEGWFQKPVHVPSMLRALREATPQGELAS